MTPPQTEQDKIKQELRDAFAKEHLPYWDWQNDCEKLISLAASRVLKEREQNEALECNIKMLENNIKVFLKNGGGFHANR